MVGFWWTERKTISSRNMEGKLRSLKVEYFFLGNIDLLFVYVWSLLGECLEKVVEEIEKWRQRREKRQGGVKNVLCFIEFDILFNSLRQMM